MRMHGNCRRLVVGFVAVATWGAAGSALAATSGGGQAYGLGVSATLPLAGIPGGTLADTGLQSAPPGLSFSQSASVVSANVTGGVPALGLSLATGAITANADGALNLNEVTSEAEVAGVNFGLVGAFNANLATLTANAITATATATCVDGTPAFSAQTDITNLAITGANIPVLAPVTGTYTAQNNLVNVNVPSLVPNRPPLLTIRLTLNENNVTGNRLAVTGLRLYVNVTNLTNGATLANLDVAVGHAEAELADCAAAEGSVDIDIVPASVNVGNQGAVQVMGTCTAGASDVAITVTDVEPPATADASTTVACGPAGTYSTTVDVSGQNDGTLTFTAVQDTQSDNDTVTKNTALPAVAITSAAPITAANDDAYPVSGTCTYDSTTPAYNVVTVAVGGVTASPAPDCLPNGTWSATVDVSGVPDGNPIVVTASQTNENGTGNDTRNTSKNTAAPQVTAVPVGGAWAGLLLLATGMGVLRRRAKAGRA